MLIVEDTYIKATGYTEEELKLEIAIMLFSKEKLSLRKAAAMSGVHWLNFMKELDKREIAIHYDEFLL
jgi:predicted HTH domain antitoxin